MNILKVAIVITVLALSANVNASVISVDWQTSGDNSITRDSVSGLDWLDLTETSGLSYEFVSGQFGQGGQLDGWRYASLSEIKGLWDNFGIDFSGAFPNMVGPIDTRIVEAVTYLGDTFSGISNTYGVSGITNAPFPGITDAKMVLGAYHGTNNGTGFNHYDTINNPSATDMASTTASNGHYIVQSFSVVPVPAAVWLFGSGLLGLVGFARRKA